MATVDGQPATSPEHGETLIEVLIALVILSVGVIGIVGAITNSVSGANRLRGRAEISQVVSRVADVLQREDWKSFCKGGNPVSTYKTNLDLLLPTSSWSISLVSMSHWGPSRDFEAGCPPVNDAYGNPTNDTFKSLRLTIKVTAPGNRGTQSFELVKRPWASTW